MKALSQPSSGQAWSEVESATLVLRGNGVVVLTAFSDVRAKVVLVDERSKFEWTLALLALHTALVELHVLLEFSSGVVEGVATLAIRSSIVSARAFRGRETEPWYEATYRY